MRNLRYDVVVFFIFNFWRENGRGHQSPCTPLMLWGLKNPTKNWPIASRGFSGGFGDVYTLPGILTGIGHQT